MYGSGSSLMGKKILKWIFFLLLIISAGAIVLISTQGQIAESANNILPTKQQKVTNHTAKWIEKHILQLQDFAVDPQKSQKKPVVIYFVPHADDEVLTYGIPIRNDIRAGKEVFVVLVSHGDSTGAIIPINKKLKKKLTSRELGQARIAEFRDSTTRLGIDDNHKIVYDLLINTMTRQKDRDRLTEIVKHYAQQFPHAEFKGMSITDPSSDHTLIGEVLSNLLEQKIISKVQIYASINLIHTCQADFRCQNNLKKRSKPEIIGKVTLTKKDDQAIINKAMNAYFIWDPQKGRYAIGKHSVPQQFYVLKKQFETIIVKK